MDNIIYFDNFATTSLNEEVFDSMKNFLIIQILHLFMNFHKSQELLLKNQEKIFLIT